MNVVPTCQILSGSDTKAIKIALTGTPLITYKKDGKTKESHATTRDIFGDYIHKYYYNQSIDDGFLPLQLDARRYWDVL